MVRIKKFGSYDHIIVTRFTDQYVCYFKQEEDSVVYKMYTNEIIGVINSKNRNLAVKEILRCIK